MSNIAVPQMGKFPSGTQDLPNHLSTYSYLILNLVLRILKPPNGHFYFTKFYGIRLVRPYRRIPKF